MILRYVSSNIPSFKSFLNIYCRMSSDSDSSGEDVENVPPPLWDDIEKVDYRFLKTGNT